VTTSPRPALLASVLGGLLSCVLLAACGSQVDPDTVARASGTSGLAAAPSSGGSTGTVSDTLVPDPQGAGAGDTGTVAGTATGDGSTAGLPASGGAGGDTGSGSAGSDGSGGTGGADGPGGKADKAKKPDKAAPAPGDGAASCEGFDNDQPGVTATEIRVANSSDVSGPVPGLFKSAQQGTQAFMAYFNATSSICDHAVVVDLLDSRTDASADQQAYTKACSDDFAVVGSQSAFDAGGAATAQACGIPDLRAYSLTSARTSCTTCFAAFGVRPNQVQNALATYWNQAQPEAVKHVGLLYINAGASPENAQNQKAAWEKNGWHFDVFQSASVSDFDYTTYVQQFKNAGVQLVMFTGAYQQTIKLQQAMKSQGFTPKVFIQDATIYDKGYTDQAGPLAEGTYVYSQVDLLDNLANPEVKLYRSWLQQVAPGANPTIYGAYAWSAARLFTEQATALGGTLTRATLLASLAEVTGWTSNGLHVPQDVGGKTTAECISIIQYSAGSWKKVSPGDYLCDGVTTN
jgi:ABC-type branched-subunit amino acid transport system substrate-binding protein